jgi:hypothetical protein
MRKWPAHALAVFTLVGCQQVGADSQGDNPQTQEQSTTPPLFLSCKGVQFRIAAGRKEATRTFVIPMDGAANGHISEYKKADELYYNVCTSAYTCVLNIDDGLISEIGTFESSKPNSSSTHTFRINRRTGEVDEQEFQLNAGETSSFKGTCTPIDQPVQRTAKF